MGSPILSIERSAHATSPESSSPWLDTSSLSLPSSDVPSQMILHMLLRKHLTVLQTPVTLLLKLGTELPPWSTVLLTIVMLLPLAMMLLVMSTLLPKRMTLDLTSARSPSSSHSSLLFCRHHRRPTLRSPSSELSSE